MATDAEYELEEGALPEPEGVPSTEPVDVSGAEPFLGFGLVHPFRRGPSDWAAAGGIELVRSSVAQILGTRAASDYTQGELPWRTEFGSLLHLLRQRGNDETTRELARVYVADALARWEPRVRVTGVALRSQEVEPGRGKTALSLHVRVDVIDRNIPGNQVLVSGLEVAVPLQ